MILSRYDLAESCFTPFPVFQKMISERFGCRNHVSHVPDISKHDFVTFRIAGILFRAFPGLKNDFVTFRFAEFTFRNVSGVSKNEFVTVWFAGIMFRNVSIVSKHDFVTFRFAEITFRMFPVFQNMIS